MSAHDWPQTALGIGERIRDARRQEGLSQEQLAHEIGSRQATISAWENGRTFPAIPDLFRICHVLGLDIYDLLPARLLDEPPPALMRAAVAEIPSGRRFRASLELFLYRAASLPSGEPKVKVRLGTPEQTARSLIKAAGLESPPVDVELLARLTGARITVWEAMPNSVSGLLVEFEGGPVIVGNAGHPIERQRFTIAHELGHHLLRHIREFHVDLSSSEEAAAAPGYDRDNEKEANQFAAELLMPTKWVKEATREESDVDALAEIFQVSDIAMGYRMLNLGLSSASP